MAAEYVSKHKLAQTIEKALSEALAKQPDNPYEALAEWFTKKAADGGAAPAPAPAPAKAKDDFGTGEKKAGEGNGTPTSYPTCHHLYPPAGSASWSTLACSLRLHLVASHPALPVVQATARLRLTWRRRPRS